MAKHNAPYKVRHPEKYLLAECKRRAKRVGLPFSLTLEDIKVPRMCPVLGLHLTFAGGDSATSPSIDRIDSALGYTPINIVIISWRANKLKGDASPHDLWELAKFYAGIRSQRGIEE